MRTETNRAGAAADERTIRQHELSPSEPRKDELQNVLVSAVPRGCRSPKCACTIADRLEVQPLRTLSDTRKRNQKSELRNLQSSLHDHLSDARGSATCCHRRGY